MARGQEFAFISDVHSNLEALESVLERIGAREIYCLGDVVGYGASPNEVVDLLKVRGATMVIGNHDVAALTYNVSEFNSRAAVAAIWTAKQLTRENREFLLALPREKRLDLAGAKAYMTHGSPDDNLWEYVYPGTHSELFGYYLRRLAVRVIALGHTHVPFAWKGPEGTVFNPGSVGQPRDSDPHASFAVLSVDGEEMRVEHHRVRYDVETSAKKILASGLPDALARRLYTGQ